jgi:hypothetical protein
VPAATTRFAAPLDDGRVAGRLVWSEAMSDGDAASGEGAASGEVAAPGGGAGPGEGAASEGALSLTEGDGRKTSAPTAAWTSPTDAPDRPRQPEESGQAIVTRRADRRRSLQKAKQRRRLSAASGRAVVVALFAVAVVVLLLVAQRGGF